MDRLPTGTVTMLFTDIEGSTRLQQQLGECYANLLADCRSLLRSVFQQHNGHGVDTQGDTFFITFARATDAISATVAAQRAFATHSWPEGVTVRVRMGVHTGEPQLFPEGYVGLDVPHAARIMSAGHGGQVLLSQTTRDLVEHALPEDVHLRDLGAHRLKDLQSPTHLFQLVITGLPAHFPPLLTLDASPNNLPIQLTPFIGREKEVAAVLALLNRADIRLLTLTGPGGTGKTRMALQVAAEVSERFTDGVYFVNLASIIDPALVAPTIAQTLEVKETAGQSLLNLLREFLREKHLMLLLDNFEQVVDASVSVADLLAACPRLKIMVTSRAVLHLRGEQEYAVPPLDVPDPKHLPDLMTLSQYEAVILFTLRAQAVKPEFQVSTANAPALAEICARLDGLPLAIELAAVRLQAMSLAEVTAGIDERFALLTSGSRTAPRQRSLAAAISWSYDLLDASSQRAFDTLGVFSGPFPQRGAAAVGDVTIGELVALVERSLVQRGADGRFVLLESLRAFAADRLVESGRVSDVRRRHATWVLDEAIEAERALDRDARSAFAELDALLPEIRAAHRFMLEIGDADGDVRLVRALNSYAFFRMRPELLAWGEEAAVLGRAAGHPGTPSVLAAAGLAAWKRGDLDELRAHADDALATAGALGLPVGLDVANVIGVHGLVTGDLDDAERWFAAALSASDAPDNPVQRMVTATDRVLAAAYAKSDRAAALTEALIAAIPDHPTPHGAYAWHGAAEAVMDDDPEEARTRAQRSLDEAEVTGAWFVTGVAGTLAASIDARRGDVMRAITAYQWLLPWWRKAGEWSVLGTLLRSMAELLHQVGRNRSAAVLLAAVLTPGAGHEVFGDDARRLADLARRLEPELGDEFHVATAEGSALTVEEAATLAEAELDAI